MTTATVAAARRLQQAAAAPAPWSKLFVDGALAPVAMASIPHGVWTFVHLETAAAVCVPTPTHRVLTFSIRLSV
jgi:hypothetical protein